MEKLQELLLKLIDSHSYLFPALTNFLEQEAKDINFVIVDTFKGSAVHAPMCSYRNSIYINKSKFKSSFHSVFILIHEIGHVKQYLREGEKIYEVWNLEFEEAFNKVLEIEIDADNYAVLNMNKVLRESYVLQKTHDASTHRQNFNNPFLLAKYKDFIRDVYDVYKTEGLDNLDPEKCGFI